MKKALLVFLSVVSVFAAKAQATFTTPADTLFAIMNSEGSVEVYNNITPTGASVTIDWHITYQNIPSSITSLNILGICDNKTCYMYSGSNPGWNDMHTTKEILPNDNNLKLFKMLIDAESYPANANGPYYITVMLMDHNSSYMKNVTFAIQKFPTSVSSVAKAGDDISIYPNPARNEINAVFNSNIKTIAVYNLIGKVVSVYKVNGSSAKLDLSNVPSGIYFMRLVDNAGQIVATRRFTRQ
ncbi:MAG: T9SS type A sorting domain-containing protein [Sphingobacteriales bacterium]|nr:MAG: T9SS type A sorting domain-containing protein [Sphingobacteriales bacterium]